MAKAGRPCSGASKRALLVLVLAMLASCSNLFPDASDEDGAADVPVQVTVSGRERPCGVSRILVPECGAWFGASTPSLDGAFDYARGLDEYEAVAGPASDILHFYKRGGKPFPTPRERELAERPRRERSLLLYSWKPDPSLTWRQIADGMADPSIASVAEGLSQYEHRLFLTIHHEPENDVVANAMSGMTTDDYVDMYRHVVASLRSAGVANVVLVMNYMGFERWSHIVDELYPGDDVVDWIAYDPYGFAGMSSFGEIVNRKTPSGWPGFYSWATNRAPGKPIMLAEWGIDLSLQDDAAQFLRKVPGLLKTDFSAIKALVYWNSQTDSIDSRLSDENGRREPFASAFGDMAADPYFAATATSDAP
jgi:hypothetical protein